jgi:hypothetical protein
MRIGAILAAAVVAAWLLGPQPATAQDAGTSAPPAADQQQKRLSEAELDQLVAPIALYPDPLLAQVLMAATYPLEIVQAARFAESNKSLTGDALDTALAKEDWDASVKALVATPTVIAMMNDQLDWTQNLGDAVLAQQADVMDAIQRLRVKAEANGKLETTSEQKVTTTQEAGKEVIVIEPASPETVYVPYYEPSVVYGSWPYPDYPPYYFAPAPGWVVGGAIATGVAWGAGWAIGNAIWDDFDWGHGNINVDINKHVNIDRNITRNDINVGKWEHNSYHRRGVNYRDNSVQNKFAKADIRAGDRKLDFRGHSGEQVLKPGGGLGDGGRPNIGDRGPGAGSGPNLGDRKPDLGKGPDLGAGKQAALDRKPDLGKAKAAPRPNAFDPRDGAKARDYSKRGQASLGNRGTRDFAKPKGGGKQFGGGGGRKHVGGGGGRRGGGGGGRGGGRRR